jgi:hypothetical protein
MGVVLFLICAAVAGAAGYALGRLVAATAGAARRE